MALEDEDGGAGGGALVGGLEFLGVGDEGGFFEGEDALDGEAAEVLGGFGAVEPDRDLGGLGEGFVGGVGGGAPVGAEGGEGEAEAGAGEGLAFFENGALLGGGAGLEFAVFILGGAVAVAVVPELDLAGGLEVAEPLEIDRVVRLQGVANDAEAGADALGGEVVDELEPAGGDGGAGARAVGGDVVEFEEDDLGFGGRSGFGGGGRGEEGEGERGAGEVSEEGAAGEGHGGNLRFGIYELRLRQSGCAAGKG